MSFLSNNNEIKRCIIGIFCICMLAIGTLLLPSCSSDEPDNGNDDNHTQSIVTESALVGKWTLVKDNVLYSEVNSTKRDESITYSGNSYPKYKFYNVSVSDDNVITIAETSATGATIGQPLQFTLDGNDLVVVGENKIAGTVDHYDSNHSWDNLRIRWNIDYAPVKYGAPVLSTYML